MAKLKKIMRAISEGLEKQEKSSGNFPNSKSAQPSFNFQARRNRICAVGWLLFLFGTTPRRKLGGIVLKSMPNLDLARVPERLLSAAIDEAVAEMTKTYGLEVKEATRVGSNAGANIVARKILRLISLRDMNGARELFMQNATNLRDHFEPLKEKLVKLEHGACGSGSIQRLARGRTEKPADSSSLDSFSETQRRTANQRIVDILFDENETGKAGVLDTLLADVKTNPKRARSVLKFLNYTLDSSYRKQLITSVLPLAPVARFEIFSLWPWVDEKLMTRALNEAISAGRIYDVERSLVRAMSGRTSPPPKNSENRQLFEKLLRLARGKAEFGNDLLIDSAESQGVRVLGPVAIPAAFSADQEYRSAPNGTGEGVEPALTRRAKSWLKREAGNTGGLIVLCPHTQSLPFAGGRLQVAFASLGKAVQTIVANAPRTGDPLRYSDFLTAARSDGYDITLSGRQSSERNSHSHQYLDHLRSGAVLQIFFDGALVPGRKSFAPWYLRPAELPVFPAQLAISSGANVCLAATWITEGGAQVIDIVPLDPPPGTGSGMVQAMWFTQQLARATRSLALTQDMPVMRRLIADYGGPMPKRDLVPIESWLQSKSVRQSKLCWIADYDADRIAIRTASKSMTYGSLASLCLRMSNMFLHFQDTASHHNKPDREFEDQHRILSLLPASPAAVVTQLASTAAGSLLCAGLPEDPDDQLVDRLKAFDPDLIIVTISLWSRLITSDAELENWNALIIGDACDEPALDFLLDSFSEAPALPPLDLLCPAHVVYTSGSSGEPKGVVLAAGMASRMLVLDYDEPQTLLTIVRWDTATALELLPAFVANHTIVLPPIDGFSDLKQLCELMISTSATALSAPCSVLHGMLQNPRFSPELLPDLTVFFPWGEPSRERLIQDLVKRFPRAEINVTYGATEFIDVSSGKLPAEEFSKYQGSPGGFFLPGTKAVNSDGEDLQPGEIGRVEAIGYDRTLGNFKDLQSGARMFNPLKDPILLDDWVMVLPDGSLDVLGRVDDVVNIRGRRLSLNDVAEAAESVAGVARVFVTTIIERDADAVAIAVETKRKDVNDLEDELRRIISRKTFAAAAPQRITHMEELPRLPSGKLDRKKLQTFLGRDRLDASVLLTEHAVTAAMSDVPLSPMLELLREFANQEGLVPYASFDPEHSHPYLDSVLSLILMLNIEKRLGKFPVTTVLDRQVSTTWRELADDLCSVSEQF